MAKAIRNGIVVDVSTGEKSKEAVLATVPASPTTVTKPAATAATSTTPFGYSQAQADALVLAVRTLTTALAATGLIVEA